MSELKFCPFCDAALFSIDGGESYRHPYVYTSDCILVRLNPFVVKKNDLALWNRRADGWVSVEERLPDPYREENYELRVCYASGTVGIADYVMPASSGGWGFYLSGSGIGPVNVTHWQPLPDPPSSGGE